MSSMGSYTYMAYTRAHMHTHNLKIFQKKQHNILDYKISEDTCEFT